MKNHCFLMDVTYDANLVHINLFLANILVPKHYTSQEWLQRQTSSRKEP
jgi:hypothetical protein